MRAVVQRVRHAQVQVAGQVVGAIGPGLLVLLGVETTDTPDDAQWLSAKIANLRIFADDAGLMNRSVIDTQGQVLLVSQFTLLASTRKGNRPSYTRAARPELAEPMYLHTAQLLETLIQRPVARGVFGADMQVELLNDGPVTIWFDTQQKE